jgi:SAM-dependent methyltransferase
MRIASGPGDPAAYWDAIADEYQSATTISTRDFHYGPLLPGDGELNLLPADIRGLRCLEAGGGAAQNSIALARRGAICEAFDASAEQLGHAARLCARDGVHVNLFRASLDDPDALPTGPYDLIHSTYALPFAERPAAFLGWAARHLNPGGVLLTTWGHPLYAGEWVEFDDGATGAVVEDYFHPPADTRRTEDGGAACAARVYPLSRPVEWMREAGLQLDRLLEPEPLDAAAMSPAERNERIPYYSADWMALFPQLARIPIVAVYRAVCPGAGASG